MSGKVILVTGASTGLGLETALLLAKNGHRVWATMRNLEKKDTLERQASEAGVEIKFSQMDVQNFETVRRSIQEVISEEGKIDVLVNNAGAGFLRALECATIEEIQDVMDVNFLGVVRTIQTVLPHMRLANQGHIINITSVGGLVGQPFNEIYCAAKFAVEGLSESMATYLDHGFNIKMTIVEPGGIRTEFAQRTFSKIAPPSGSEESGASAVYQPLLNSYLSSAKARIESGTTSGAPSIYQSALEVAEVIASVVDNPNPPLRVRTSLWAETFCQLKTQADPSGTLLKDILSNASFPK